MSNGVIGAAAWLASDRLVPMAYNPVRMRLRWSVPPGESRPLMVALQGIMLATRADAGCIGCGLSTDVGLRVALSYVEEWSDQAHLERRLSGPRFAVLAELMEQASEPPVVEFELHGARRGLDYAEEVRRRTDRE